MPITETSPRWTSRSLVSAGPSDLQADRAGGEVAVVALAVDPVQEAGEREDGDRCGEDQPADDDEREPASARCRSRGAHSPPMVPRRSPPASSPPPRASEGRGRDPRGELELVEPREARAGADAGGDARRAVGVHQDDRVRAVLDLPVQRAAAVAGGDPEALVLRPRGLPGSGLVAVAGVERVDVDVGQRGVGGAAQVGVDVTRAGDAGEQRLAVDGRDVDADLAERAAGRRRRRGRRC